MTTPRVESPDLRRRELAQIHIARKDLGMDEETYRAMLHTIGRVASARELDHAGRKRVLEHLRSRGFQGRTAAARGDSRPRPARPAASLFDHPTKGRMLTKIDAMLHEAGREWFYAHTIAARMFGADRAEWLHEDQLHLLVRALDRDRKRHKP